ncbi:MAG: type IV pilin [Haloarculaceae archaeon]
MATGTRGQSTLVGIVLLVAVVVVAVGVVGVFVFDRQARGIRNADPSVAFTSDVNASNVKLSHAGGPSFRLQDLDLVLKGASGTLRYDLDDPADRNDSSLGGDGRFDSGDWVLVDHDFEDEVQVRLIDTSAGGHVLYDETKAVVREGPKKDPTVETFQIADHSTNEDASFDVTWKATDVQGDITEVTVRLVDQSSGVVQDSATTTFGEVATTGTHTDTLTNASGSGEVYAFEITVTDAAGNTETAKKTDAADSDVGLRPSVIERFDVVDVTTNAPAYDVTYNASDPDGDLIEVTLELVDASTGTVVDNTTDGYPQVKATGVETDSLNYTSGKNQKFHVNISVRDTEGNVVRESTTDVADGSGGGGGGGSDPTIDTFDVMDTSTCGNTASYDVDWAVSDADGNLDSVTVELIRTSHSNVEDSASYTTTDPELSGSSGSDTVTLSKNGRCGEQMTVEITVIDDAGNTVTKSWTDTADGSGNN